MKMKELRIKELKSLTLRNKTLKIKALKIKTWKLRVLKINCYMYIILFSLLSACSYQRRDNGPTEVGRMDNQDELSDQVKSITYQKDGIAAQYPELAAGGSEEQLKLWNEIIASDFNKILGIYSFRPIPEPTPAPAASIPTILKLTYEIKLINNRYVSIFYTASFNSPYAAHPTGLVYTTNLDKEENKRLALSDIVKVNQDFVKNFRSWELVVPEGVNAEVTSAMKDYITNMSDEDLLMGFNAADIIGSGNLYGVYSYLTRDRLGISIGVPNYLGDHMEFEKAYTDLTGFLVQGFDIPGQK